MTMLDMECANRFPLTLKALLAGLGSGDGDQGLEHYVVRRSDSVRKDSRYNVYELP